LAKAPPPDKIGEPPQSNAQTFCPRLAVLGSAEVTAQAGDQSIGFDQGHILDPSTVEFFFMQ